MIDGYPDADGDADGDGDGDGDATEPALCCGTTESGVETSTRGVTKSAAGVIADGATPGVDGAAGVSRGATAAPPPDGFGLSCRPRTGGATSSGAPESDPRRAEGSGASTSGVSTSGASFTGTSAGASTAGASSAGGLTGAPRCPPLTVGDDEDVDDDESVPDPVEPPDPVRSANANGIATTAEPTPRATANAPTRPTNRAGDTTPGSEAAARGNSIPRKHRLPARTRRREELNESADTTPPWLQPRPMVTATRADYSISNFSEIGPFALFQRRMAIPRCLAATLCPIPACTGASRRQIDR